MDFLEWVGQTDDAHMAGTPWWLKALAVVTLVVTALVMRGRSWL